MRPGAAASGCARKIEVEREKGGGWHLLVSEIPYGVQKGKLIEQIAELIADKKLPILADVRDESDEEVRIVLEPRARTVDPELLLESLYRLTDLEMRFPLNLNVLDATRTPGVMSLKQALLAWLDFQIEVLVRRSQVRIGKIDDRLELLDGFLIAFLNLDRVIEIIRTEDEPKPVMMAEFALTDRQAEAILNMRLRSLRRLEEMEIGKERAALAKEREELVKLVESPARQRTRLKTRPRRAARTSSATSGGRGSRKSAPAREIDWTAMIEKEPITVILSQRGWIRAMKGHVALERGRRPQVARGRRAVHPLPRPDHRPAALFASTTAGSTRWPATSCPARAASASRCGCSSTSRPRSRSSQLLVVRPEMKLLVASSRRARASSPAARRRWPRRARASSWSTCGPARRSPSCGRSRKAPTRSR